MFTPYTTFSGLILLELYISPAVFILVWVSEAKKSDDEQDDHRDGSKEEEEDYFFDSTGDDEDELFISGDYSE